MNATAQQQALISILETRRITSYVEAASVTLVVYDYLITLDAEIKYVWGSRWSLITLLYYLTKYLLFVDGLGIVFQTFVSSSIVFGHCRAITFVGGAIFVTGTCTAETILAMKAWAVWGKDKRLGITLLIIFTAIIAGVCVCISLFFKSLEFADTASASAPSIDLTGCSVIRANPNFLVADWILIMTMDAIVTLLLMIRGIHAYKMGGNSGLLRVLYRDGMIYFIYMAGMSIVNLILIFNLPPGFLLLTTFLTRVIHVSLASRVVLRTREYAGRSVHMFNSRGDEQSWTVSHSFVT
ncbi:hypothetical protein AMATHDRAFT_71220 [Amanita thiersii Skay4041]|uniref:DUF6533 domain-containing protein n=1 Tax=Amanita thiersii Skay4041 TaxID=703135 RepID=A0A2A9NBP9_9AGAR|nr:hypothetical protein AMATHDRAFT_71220 [Amanita thiersii Skay4041]